MTTMATLTKAPVLEDYFGKSDAELHERIEAARATLGERLVILGHHYQRDDVICHADIIGDSFKLSKLGAERDRAEFIVFCGVHFMAESADILSAPHQKVILPDLGAGCSLNNCPRRCGFTGRADGGSERLRDVSQSVIVFVSGV